MTTLAHRAPRTAPPSPLKTGRRVHWIAHSIVCVALAAVAAGSLVMVMNSLDTIQPLPAFVTAVNEGDGAALAELLIDEAGPWREHSEWLVATGASLSLGGCSSSTDGLITCHIHYGDEWFYNRAAPPDIARKGNLASSLTVEIIDQQLRVIAWPLPDGLAEVEEAFQAWALRAHPDMAGLLWRTTSVGPGLEKLRIDATGGEAHLAMLKEYLRFLNPPVV